MLYEEDFLKQTKETFDQQVITITGTIDVLKTVTSVYENLFTNLIHTATETGTCYDLIRKAKRNIALIKEIQGQPYISGTTTILRWRGVCELVSYLETFLHDIFCHLAEKNSNDFVKALAEKGKDLKIPREFLVEQGIQNLEQHLGQLVMDTANNKINFQDLQSTKREFETYFNLKIDSKVEKEEQEDIILMQAIRHIITHKNGVVDKKFTDQIRNTKNERDYQINDTILVDDLMLKHFMETTTNLTNTVLSLIRNN